MFLKSLEMVGFKSFPDKVKLEFQEGFTSVVGPNGCGKSNIMDAVRWGLGEQGLKALRCKRGEELIFQGTESRPPVGMAEVTLTFDNSVGSLPIDFTEVSVTRRLFRSGESEYYLNKVPCRLRDIQELFMDTGVGKVAYSMIGQGNVDMILSSRPEDRRYVCDEAAGIVKYKAKRNAALRHLESAEFNLLRLRDIISEVEKRIRSLRRQAGAARRYQKHRGRLHGLELMAAKRKYEKWEHDRDELAGNVSRMQEDDARFRARLSEVEAGYEKAHVARLEIDQEAMASQQQIHTLENQMERAESTIRLEEERARNSRSQIKRLELELGRLGVESAKTRAEAQAAVHRNRTFEARESELREELESRTQTLQKYSGSHREKESELETHRSAALEIANAAAEAHNTLQTVEVRISDLDQRSQTARKGLEAAQVRQKEIREKLLSCEVELDNLQVALEETNEAISKKKEEKEEAVRAVNSSRRALLEQRDELTRLQGRLESLSELKESREGLEEGAKYLLEKGKSEFGNVILGGVAELFQVPKEFEAAVEALLGEDLQAVVVENDETARRILSKLREEDHGNVTLLSRERIARLGSRERPSSKAGSRPAKDVVRCDEKFRPIVEFLLGNSLIAEDSESAWSILADVTEDCRVVTTAGEILEPSGRFRGGRKSRSATGLLSRGLEIEKIEAELGRGHIRTEEVEKEAVSLEEKVGQIESDLTRLSNESNEVSVRLAAAEKDALYWREELEKKIQELRVYENELKALEEELKNLETQKKEAEESFRSLTADRKSNEERLSTLAEEISDLRREIEAAGEMVTEVRLRLTAVERDLQNSRAEAERLEAQVAENAEIEERLRGEFREAESQEEAALDKKAEQEQLLIVLQSERKQAIDVRTAIESRREEAGTEAGEAEKQMKAAREQVDALAEKLREGEVALAQVRERIANLDQRVLDEFGLELKPTARESSLVAAIEEKVDAEAVEELLGLGDDEIAKEVDTLNKKISALGTVNLVAADEYEDLEARAKLLREQEDDLLKARQSLKEVVTKLNRTAEEKFLSTFTAVQGYFSESFRKLFAGGRGELFLLDPEDPLESGIEIVARPPGKKLQGLGLLSGGERAMTAVALLFAVFRAKPSPFCILDEIDAPLDDVNIGRFVDLLSEFLSRSQFLVITHNKRTMARSDTLYGVTMEERGVSQVVSVRFQDYEDQESHQPAMAI